jgi:hypothetical protein
VPDPALPSRRQLWRDLRRYRRAVRLRPHVRPRPNSGRCGERTASGASRAPPALQATTSTIAPLRGRAGDGIPRGRVNVSCRQGRPPKYRSGRRHRDPEHAVAQSPRRAMTDRYSPPGRARARAARQEHRMSAHRARPAVASEMSRRATDAPTALAGASVRSHGENTAIRATADRPARPRTTGRRLAPSTKGQWSPRPTCTLSSNCTARQPESSAHPTAATEVLMKGMKFRLADVGARPPCPRKVQHAGGRVAASTYNSMLAQQQAGPPQLSAAAEIGADRSIQQSENGGIRVRSRE